MYVISCRMAEGQGGMNGVPDIQEGYQARRMPTRKQVLVSATVVVTLFALLSSRKAKRRVGPGQGR